jgi:DNA-binding transcriptional MocR family regulator
MQKIKSDEKLLNNRLNWLNNLASKKIKYNLGAGTPPLDLYPDFNPGNLFGTETVFSSDKSINYHPTAGFIKNAAVKVLEENEGLCFDAENIIISNGVQEAIAITVACFRKKTIACIDPSYPGFEDAATAFGCKLVKLPLDNWLNSLNQLPEGSLLYISADFSNPLGYSLTLEERFQLTNIAEKNKFYIFDDATYRPFNLDKTLPALIAFNSNYVIHAISFSKILAPGLRTAFIYLPSALQKNFIEQKSNLSLNNSGITQRIVEKWLQENNYQLSAHLIKAKNRLKMNRKVTRKYGITYYGGFFCNLNLSHKADFAFCEALLKIEEIAVIPMSIFSDNPKFDKQVRLSLTNIEHTELEQALSIIKNFIP